MGNKMEIPKLIVDNFEKKNAPFYDATGAHAGALLGDVLHDPFQSGGLGTPANQRVVAGMIHKAHNGVLFLDEIATLNPRTQQELLSALQEKQLGQLRPADTNAASLYTPGNNVTAIIKAIYVCNTTGNTPSYRIFVDDDGTTGGEKRNQPPGVLQ